MASDTTTSRLLALPDPCLLAVMQCCAHDTRSVLSAATAHSRLQRAAVEALSSISATVLGQRQFSGGLLLYLAKHGQHVRSLALHGPCFLPLCELPPSLTKLDSMQLHSIALQPAVLRAGPPLTWLELNNCSVLDGAQGLAAVLVQLPDLEHLKVTLDIYVRYSLAFPTDVLQHLQKLTCLSLEGVDCRNRNSSSSDPSAGLQPLQALTRLVDLQLRPAASPLTQLHCVTADMLSGADQLTRLVLSRQLFEPRTLAGKAQLQHLTLMTCDFVPGAYMAQLLSELQHLTQLTHLDLGGSWQWFEGADGPSPPPAAYASLTASSRLQHLAVGYTTLPSAAWQYMCPPGRTLPHLQYLDISFFGEGDGSWPAPDTTTLVRWCPGLQSLKSSTPCSTAQVAPLQRLTGLHTLAVYCADGGDNLEGVQALCQLTGLRELKFSTFRAADARILQLTQLTQLTALILSGGAVHEELRWDSQDPASEPVWRQLLRQLHHSRDPAVAQQAAAALEAA